MSAERHAALKQGYLPANNQYIKNESSKENRNPITNTVNPEPHLRKLHTGYAQYVAVLALLVAESISRGFSRPAALTAATLP